MAGANWVAQLASTLTELMEFRPSLRPTDGVRASIFPVLDKPGDNTAF
jgi:hypothetical protein